MRNAALNPCVQVFLCGHKYLFLLRVELGSGLCGTSMYNLLNDHQTDSLQCLFPIIFLPAMYEGSSFSPSSPTLGVYLPTFLPFYPTVLVNMKKCVIIILICISLITNDVEQLSMYLLDNCLSSWKNVYPYPSIHLKLVTFFVVDLWEFFIYSGY